MNILVFSDPHGRIALIYRIIYEFQKNKNFDVDLVLVTGDLGIFPDINKMDKMSLKFALKDASEFGFSRYFEPIISSYTPFKEIGQTESVFMEKILPAIKCKIIFVGGNHEDYEYLKLCINNQDVIVPVEKRKKLWYLQNNYIYDFNGLRICGISGLDKNKCNPKKHNPMALIDDNKIRNFIDSVFNYKPHILLTHDGLNNPSQIPDNSSCFLSVIQNINPVYHFFGHYHWAIEVINYSEKYLELKKTRTRGVLLNETNFDSQGNLNKNCIGFLQWENEDNNSFTYINDDWLKNITKYGWDKL